MHISILIKLLGNILMLKSTKICEDYGLLLENDYLITQY